jgi:hypothetical protein
MGKYKHPVPGFCYFMLQATAPNKGGRDSAFYFLIYCDMISSVGFYFLKDDSSVLDYLSKLDAQITRWEPIKPFYPPPTTDLKDFINAVTEEKQNPLL